MRKAQTPLRSLGHARAVGREAAASARAQIVTSLLAIAAVAGMCCAVHLSVGRTVALEQEVLSRLDNVATRTIVVRTSSEVRIDSSALAMVALSPDVATAVGLGPPMRVANAALPAGKVLSARDAFGMDAALQGADAAAARRCALRNSTSHDQATPGCILASRQALSELAMTAHAGSLEGPQTGPSTVIPIESIPDSFAPMEPLLLRPVPAVGSETGEGLALLVVEAVRAEAVPAARAIVSASLAGLPPDGATIETSQDLAQAHKAVAGDLGSFSRMTLVGTIGLGTLLVTMVMTVAVMLRRKDFGRRRALGASRAVIVGLVLTQVAFLAIAGIAIGSLVAAVVLTARGASVPDWGFLGAVATLALTAALIGALVPATFAARRSPLHELRTP